MSEFEPTPEPQSIDYMDTLVPVDFVTNAGTERLLFPPEHAQDEELMGSIAETFKRYSFDEVVIHVGYSRAEGGPI